MFIHLLKLIWNKKKQNFILMSEMLLSFLVIFAVFSLMVYYYLNYRKPMGLDYERIWLITYNESAKIRNADSLLRFHESLRQMVLGMPQVKEFSYATNSPFSHSTSNNGSVFMYWVDDHYRDVLGFRLLEGRWFNRGDIAGRIPSVVINQTLRERAFGKGPAVDKLIGIGGENNNRVIGVVQDAKLKGDYAAAVEVCFNRLDSNQFRSPLNILVKAGPDVDAAFENHLYQVLASYMKDGSLEIRHLDDMRVVLNQQAILPVIAGSIVAGFLVINVALGLFGILWYAINKRRAEIGLRRAVGASGPSVSSQLVAESLILATLSVSLGVIFAVQFPLLKIFNVPAQVYGMAIVLSLLFIYLLVVVCSLYPGRQAAAIYPAVALHED